MVSCAFKLKSKLFPWCKRPRWSDSYIPPQVHLLSQLISDTFSVLQTHHTLLPLLGNSFPKCYLARSFQVIVSMSPEMPGSLLEQGPTLVVFSHSTLFPLSFYLHNCHSGIYLLHFFPLYKMWLWRTRVKLREGSMSQARSPPPSSAAENLSFLVLSNLPGISTPAGLCLERFPYILQTFQFFLVF